MKPSSESWHTFIWIEKTLDRIKVNLNLSCLPAWTTKNVLRKSAGAFVQVPHAQNAVFSLIHLQVQSLLPETSLLEGRSHISLRCGLVSQGGAAPRKHLILYFTKNQNLNYGTTNLEYCMNYFCVIKNHSYNKELCICMLGIHNYIQENTPLCRFTRSYRYINAGHHVIITANLKWLN